MWNLSMLKRMMWLCVFFAYTGNSIIFVIVRYNLLYRQQGSHPARNLLRADKITLYNEALIVKQVDLTSSPFRSITNGRGQKNKINQGKIFNKI